MVLRTFISPIDGSVRVVFSCTVSCETQGFIWVKERLTIHYSHTDKLEAMVKVECKSFKDKS